MLKIIEGGVCFKHGLTTYFQLTANLQGSSILRLSARVTSMNTPGSLTFELSDHTSPLPFLSTLNMFLLKTVPESLLKIQFVSVPLKTCHQDCLTYERRMCCIFYAHLAIFLLEQIMG